jgi:hypothetical protein
MKMPILLMAAEVLFIATQFTPPQSFTAQIEGPACDRAGNVYAVSFERKATIGRVSPEGKGEVFLEMPHRRRLPRLVTPRMSVMRCSSNTS